jgi:CheY-like chemotaxis protein
VGRDSQSGYPAKYGRGLPTRVAFAAMGSAWNVLVVDDAEDVHDVTRLALKRKTWRGRPFALTHARSGKEAREILSDNGARFHAALVDVVMESEHAGLELCDFIRSTLPRTVRIVLRTGQPGAAPPIQVMNDYDIDYYLAKPEVTEDRLYATLRACFRSSQDIAVVLEVSSQLRAFTIALQDAATTRASLAEVMVRSLRFLEEKYSAKVTFVDDVGVAKQNPATRAAAEAVEAAHKKQLAPKVLHPGPELKLGDKAFVVLATSLVHADRTEPTVGDRVKRWFKSLVQEQTDERMMGTVVDFETMLPPKLQEEFTQDLDLFVANWSVAESTLRLQQRIVSERMEIMKNYGQV